MTGAESWLLNTSGAGPAAAAAAAIAPFLHAMGRLYAAGTVTTVTTKTRGAP